MPTTHPFTEEDTILLNLYLTPSTELFYICEELGITFSELERRLEQPHIKEAIERATRLHEQRAKTLARCRSEDAICTLSHLAGQPEINPETRRKAASQLIRVATAHVSKRAKRPSNAKRQRSRQAGTQTVPSPIGRGQGEGAPTSAPPLARFTNSAVTTLSPPHCFTRSPSHACDTSPARTSPDSHVYQLHPFTHRRITRTDTPPDNPRPP